MFSMWPKRLHLWRLIREKITVVVLVSLCLQLKQKELNKKVKQNFVQVKTEIV